MVPGSTRDHEGERLQKMLARAGLGSRRTCEQLIEQGRVTVDGEVAVLGRRADARDRIELDGVRVVTDTDLVTYLLHKPAGVVTTSSDPHGRATVIDLVPRDPRVFAVGRLDLDTEGLLLLTNDGELAQLVAHPSHGVDKTYLAEVDGAPSPGVLRTLRAGVDLDDGLTAPAKVSVVARHGDRSAVEITIHEGRNRQVRRMFEAVGHPVRRLVRTRIGPIRDPQLTPSQWRRLSGAEIRSLLIAAEGKPGDSEPHR